MKSKLTTTLLLLALTACMLSSCNWRFDSDGSIDSKANTLDFTVGENAVSVDSIYFAADSFMDFSVNGRDAYIHRAREEGNSTISTIDRVCPHCVRTRIEAVDVAELVGCRACGSLFDYKGNPIFGPAKMKLRTWHTRMSDDREHVVISLTAEDKIGDNWPKPQEYRKPTVNIRDFMDQGDSEGGESAAGKGAMRKAMQEEAEEGQE